MQQTNFRIGKQNRPIKYHDTFVMRQALADGISPDSADILDKRH